MKEIRTTTAEQTRDIGIKIGRALAGTVQTGTVQTGTVSTERDPAGGAAPYTLPFSLSFTGDLGTGKTTLIQGLAQGLGVPEKYYVTSPTFNIMNEYPAGPLKLCHLDLYRLGSPEELDYLGFEDSLDDTTVVAVEWPGLLKETGFDFDLEIQVRYDQDFNRIIALIPAGQQGSNLVSNLFP